MATANNALAASANAQLGIPLPLAYGYNRVRGDNVLLYEQANKNRVAFFIMGEGMWDGIENLWINAKLVNVSDTSLVHFHPGINGVLGSGLAPSSNGGDQGVDNFFSLIPGNYRRLTFSRKAYIAVNVPPDPAAPSANLDVVGDYRCCKVRIFDVNGNQTSFQFSTNGAWQILDLIIRKMIKPEWDPSAASAGGGDLTAQEKARIDFASVVDSAAWCDFNIASGIKRFESSVAFPRTVKMQQALAQMEVISQLFVHETAGKIYIRADKPRASTFILTADHIIPGTGKFDKIDLHGSANRIIASFNDLNPQQTVGIDTAANSGLVRNGNIVTVKCVDLLTGAASQHPFLVNDNVQLLNPLDGSFSGQYVVASVPTTFTFTFSQTGPNATSGQGFVGTAESRFAQRSSTVDHERHQNAIGQRGLNLSAIFRRLPINIDMGNNTFERAGRILAFLKTRNLGVDAIPYNAPWTGKITAFLSAVDSHNSALAAQLMGDIITIDSTISEEYQGDYEITETVLNIPQLSGSANNSGSSSSTQKSDFPTIDLVLKQYLPAAFSDVSIDDLGVVASISRAGIGLIPVSDNLVRNGDFGAGQANWTVISGSAQFRVNVSGLPRGNSEFFTNANFTQIESNEFIPIDQSKIYLFEIWLKIGASPSHCFCGFGEYDLNHSFVNHTPASFFAGWPVIATSTTSNGWQYFAVEVTGNGGSNPSTTQFNQSAAFVRIKLLVNDLPGETQTVEIGGLRWSEVAAGTRRAINALDTNSQLASTFKNNPINANGAFTGSNPLSQSGTTTTILVSSNSVQFGAGQVSYNSGSVNPGSYGTWYVYTDDRTFAGGSVTYQASANQNVQMAADGRISFGKITTTSGGGGSGSGGGGGGCFSGNVLVDTPDGPTRFDQLSQLCEILTEYGARMAHLKCRHYDGEMLDMDHGELVTPSHIMKMGPVSWGPARNMFFGEVHYSGKVYTLEVVTDKDTERHFRLSNGRIAHNFSPLQ